MLTLPSQRVLRETFLGWSSLEKLQFLEITILKKKVTRHVRRDQGYWVTCMRIMQNSSLQERVQGLWLRWWESSGREERHVNFFERVDPKAICALGKNVETSQYSDVAWQLKVTSSRVVSKISCFICILCIFDGIWNVVAWPEACFKCSFFIYWIWCATGATGNGKPSFWWRCCPVTLTVILQSTVVWKQAWG